MTIDTVMREAVRLLAVDPDLAAGIDQAQLRVARDRVRAQVLELDRPRWDPGDLRARAEPGWLGLLLIDGLMMRCVTLGKREACELCGPSDLIRPWDTDDDYAPLPVSLRWDVLQPTRLAVLDSDFVRRCAPWPSVTAQIVGQVAHRARYLTLTNAISHIPRADARLLVLFWLLADRWGKVSPRGIRVYLPLTHATLATLTGVQRPTATLALQRLAQAQLLIRERSDRWLLTQQGIEALNHPERLVPVEMQPI